MHLVVESAAKPLRLGLVQDRGHRVRDVDHPTGLTGHNEEEPISRFQDQMLELLQSKQMDCWAKLPLLQCLQGY